MKTKKVYTKDLRKGEKVIFYGAIFEIIENAINNGQIGWEDKPKGKEFDVWTAKCKYVEVKEGTTITTLLKNYNTFQSNSLVADICKIID